jgi:hypothetical protein
MNPPSKPRLIDWVGCGAIVLAGVAVLGLYVFARLHGTTPEEELTQVEGVPEDVTLTSHDDTALLKFTVGGFRTEYSSNSPRYEKVLAAVRSGQPVQAWISTKQETPFPRDGWVPLYKLSVGGEEVLDYATTAGDPGSWRVLVLACFLLAAGGWGLVACVRNHARYKRQATEPAPVLTEAQREKEQQGRIRNATLFLSVIVYAVILGVNFEPAVRQKHAEAWGETPFGLPVLLVVSAVETILFLPVPWFVWHAMRLMFRAIEEGRHPGVLTFFRVGPQHADLRRSQKVCLLGLLYFVTLVTAWIVYASARGI